MGASRTVKARPISPAVLALFGLTACSEAEEARRVDLPVVTDGRGLQPITTDLGYQVEVSSAWLVAEDLQFTIAGEAHTSLWRRLSEAVIPVAHAHPGHYQGGEVTGELLGRFVLQFTAEETQAVGTATLLVGQYQALDLTLAHASEDDVAEGDPLLGHSARLVGTAARDDVAFAFEIRIESPAARQLAGVPFAAKIAESTQGPLALRLSTLDPIENDTLLDGVDFALLDSDADGRVLVEPAAVDANTVAAYNVFRRTFQTHDHFVMQLQE
jgi:hypothetical protein